MSIVGVENDHQLAKKVGIAQTTISTWRKRGKVPYEFCVNIAQDYKRSVDWVLFGTNRSFDLAAMEYGFIELSLFEVCWEAAEKVVAIAPDLDLRLAAALIYNARLKTFVKFLDRKLSVEQAVFAFSVNDEIGAYDFAKYAEVIREELKDRAWLKDVFDRPHGEEPG